MFDRNLRPFLGFLGVIALVFASSCSGQVSESPQGSDGPNGGSGGNFDDPSNSASGRFEVPAIDAPPVKIRSHDGVFKPNEGGWRRLTNGQMLRSVGDILGRPAEIAAGLDPDADDELFRTVSARYVETSATAVTRYNSAADEIAAAAVEKGDLGCSPKSSTDPCIDKFVKKYGRRFFRRPLTDDEAKRYGALVRFVGEDSSDLALGLQAALSAFIQSPKFLYLLEYGEEVPGDSRARRYTSFEVASRLAFGITGSTPDDELLDAAADGDLITHKGVRTQVRRLLRGAGARQGLADFFEEHWRLDDLKPGVKDPDVYPEATPELIGDMHEEVRQYVLDFLSSGRPLPELFTHRGTHVSKALADLYDLEFEADKEGASGELTRVRWPSDEPRRGLLGLAAILSATSSPDRSSPTLRGVFIREHVLCQEVPLPPENVDTSLDVDEDGEARTVRETLTRHRDDPACSGCHEFIDPIGLGLENFDGIGRYRTTDAGERTDATGDLDGESFDGLPDLARAIREHPASFPCLVRSFFAHATGAKLGRRQEALIKALARQSEAQGFQLARLVEEVAVSDGFRYLTPAD